MEMIVPAIFGAGGAIAGAQEDVVRNSSSSRVNVGAESGLERQAREAAEGSLAYLTGMIPQAGDINDVKNAYKSSQDLAAMLQDYSKNSGLPTTDDISTANNFATNIFAARNTSLDHLFQDQNTETERLAARLGRSVADPVLQAKLRTGYMRNKDLLNAEQTGFASQMALQLPGQRLNFATARNELLGGLAAQAFNNRAAILQMGSQLMGGERGWRLNTGEQVSSGTQTSGGGLKGAINGFMAGAGGGMSMASMMGGFGGFGAPAAPAAPSFMSAPAPVASNFTAPQIQAPNFGASAYGGSNGPSLGTNISMFEPGRRY